MVNSIVGRRVNIAGQLSNTVGKNSECIYTKGIVGQNAERENSAIRDGFVAYRHELRVWADLLPLDLGNLIRRPNDPIGMLRMVSA